MNELLQIVCCPLCRRDMTANGLDMCCECGYSFKYTDGFFSIKNGLNTNYARFYTRDYFKSALYDYSSYRMSRILGLAQAARNKRILDLGCGPGEIAIRCAKLGAKVFGVDVSRDALELGAEICKEKNVEVHLFEFDGEWLPFRDKTFDSIILSDVAEHIDDRALRILVKECSRLLSLNGRLVIHTSPTRNILTLAQLMKIASLGKVNIQAKLVNPEYEFLHVRYHSVGSLKGVLERSGLHPVIWGEFRYLTGTALSQWACTFGLKNTLADQLWCLAFKNSEEANDIRPDWPYSDIMKISPVIDLGKCDELCINYGFYNPEFNSYRWTGRTASLFIEIPANYSQISIKLHTVNPEILRRPVQVKLYLAGHPIMKLHIMDQKITEVSAKLKEVLQPGPTELKLKVDRTFIPKEQGINEDGRILGIAVHRIEIS